MSEATPRKWAIKVYGAMCARCENANGLNPWYANVKLLISREDFIAWAEHELVHFRRIHSGKQASIDRIDDDGHYELGNIRIISFRENKLKQRRNKRVHAPDGQSWCSACKQYLPLAAFSKCNSRGHWHGVQRECKACRKRRRTVKSSNTASPV